MQKIQVIFWFIAFILTLISQASHANNVTFYITAHQDDWQLFMSPQAYHDIINPNNKVIFIYTTAGDAGKGTTWWQARRAGALSSIQFAKRQKIEYILPTPIKINSHHIPCHIIGNTKSYFLSLPDGNHKGEGFPITNQQSLAKLKTAAIDSINALVDASNYQTQYNSWTDVVNTIKQIIETESATSPEDSTVNFINPRTAQHSDHIYTGFSIEEALSNSNYRQTKFYDYAIMDMEPNVFGDDLAYKTGMFLFYNQTAFEMPNGIDKLKSKYIKWLSRQYQSSNTEITHIDLPSPEINTDYPQ
jgi:hypothetical protein